MKKLIALLFLAATMGVAQTTVGPTNGGTGASNPTGYLYGNGASPATASTTIPAANINWTACPTSATSGTVTVNLTTANCAIITATGGNVTVAVTSPNGPGPYAIRLCNDTTARTWTLPGSFLQIGTPFAASFCSTSVFLYDGTNYDGLGSNETPSTMRFSASRAAPANPSASVGGVAWIDSTDLDFEYQNGGAAPFKMFLSGQDCNPVTGICTKSNGSTFGSAAFDAASFFEAALGNPGTNGYILSSTTAGVRSWIAPPSGGAPSFPVNPQTATYQVVAGDFSSCKNITVASGTFTITLVASGSQPTAGQCVWVTNYGSGTVTVARSGQNINGGTSSLSLTAGSATNPTGALIVSDGTNYFANVFGEVAGSSGVSAWSGDGSLFTNSGSTGAVTATLGTQSANTGLHGPASGSSAAPTFRHEVIADLPAPAYTPLTPSSDCIAAAAQSGCVNAGTTETGFASAFLLNTATASTLDGVHQSLKLTYVWDTTGTASPTITDYLLACPSANYTPSTGVCSSGVVTFYTSGTATPSNTADQGVVAYILTATSTPGNFIVARIYNQGTGQTSAGSTSSKVTCSACSSGSWYIYPAEKWSAATSGNFRQLTSATPTVENPSF